jgi:plasmid stabilization system protein ParE
MTRRVVLRRLAISDIDRACDYYDAQSSGLGRRFAATVDEALQRISANPLQYPLVVREMRRLMLDPFPYALFFKVEGDTIRVYAVIHGARHPRTWQRRG